jgi:dTDP-4-amino-4,6-dideoxy-D-galactose acyltransferase
MLDIESVLQEARDSGVRLLYLFMPHIDESLRHAVEQTGAKAVGCKVEYSKAVHMSLVSNPPADNIAPCCESSPSLEQLALQSGIYSRFRIDDGFRNREFERLYQEWLASSLRGDAGKRVYVAGAAADPQGLITLEPDGGVARIGLLAVDAGQRGRGLGRRLVAEAERVCCREGIAELRVATQAENQGACHFYEECGFRIISEVEIFHVWLPLTQPWGATQAK